MSTNWLAGFVHVYQLVGWICTCLPTGWPCRLEHPLQSRAPWVPNPIWQGQTSTLSPVPSEKPAAQVLLLCLWGQMWLGRIPVGITARHFDLEIHFFASDTQLHVFCKIKAAQSQWAIMHTLESCVMEIQTWMAANKLCLNDSKTELVICTPWTNMA